MVHLVGTDFIGGITSVDFGPGITVDSLLVESTERMHVVLKVSATAPAGSRLVTVSNAGPGGGASNTRAFQVNNPVPEFHTIAPSNGEQGQTFDVEINGRRFIAGVTTLNMGTGILINSDTVTNDTTIIASITISSTAGTGARDIRVSNGPPGGGVSILVSGFVVGANPVPDVVTVEPDSGGRSTTMDVALTGTNFLGGITSVEFGDGIWVQNVDVDSASSLTAKIVIAPDAALGPRTVTVINRPPGGGRDSIPAGFRVVNPRPALTSIAPTSGIVQQTLDLVLTGSAFLPGVTSIAVRRHGNTDQLVHRGQHDRHACLDHDRAEHGARADAGDCCQRVTGRRRVGCAGVHRHRSPSGGSRARVTSQRIHRSGHGPHALVVGGGARVDVPGGGVHRSKLLLEGRGPGRADRDVAAGWAACEQHDALLEGHREQSGRRRRAVGDLVVHTLVSDCVRAQSDD